MNNTLDRDATVAGLIDLANTILAEYGQGDEEYLDYSDDRIKIHAEHGITITLQTEVCPVVLNSNGMHITTYRPGVWERYLEELARRAEADHTTREARDHAEFQERQARAFAPIDDRALFPDFESSKC